MAEITTSLLGELIAFHEDECMHYRAGRCLTLACLRRGGYEPTKSVTDFDEAVKVATCETHETIIALRQLRTAMLTPKKAKELV